MNSKFSNTLYWTDQLQAQLGILNLDTEMVVFDYGTMKLFSFPVYK